MNTKQYPHIDCLLFCNLKFFERNVSIVHKILNLQSYSLILGVPPPPPGPSMPFRQFMCFLHSHNISKWHPGSRGEQGQRDENV